jgi:hypothetical protein
MGREKREERRGEERTGEERGEKEDRPASKMEDKLRD